MIPARILLLDQSPQFDGSSERPDSQLDPNDDRNHEMGLALEVINLIFRKFKLARRNQDMGIVQCRRSTLSSDVERQISQAIWIHWNSTSPGISYKIKNTLKNLLEHTKHSQSDFSQSPVSQFLLESIEQSIFIEKRSLSILCYLLPCMSLAHAIQTFKIYAADPSGFLGILLNAIGDDKLASTLGQLAVHWTSKVERFELKGSKSIDSLPECHSSWVSITLSILFGSEDRKRQYLCQYYLVPLFKNQPDCFSKLTETIASMGGPHFRLHSSNSSYKHLAGIIALGRINPCRNAAQGLSSQKDINVVDPWIPDSLLQVCLSHPAVSLRSAVLAIICKPAGHSSLLSNEYLNLILEFLALNFGEIEAELKQSISSNLNLLFNRLKDCSISYDKKLSELMRRKSNYKHPTSPSPVEQASDTHQEAIQLQNQIDHYNLCLEAAQNFILEFLKLCRVNLTICSPYRCQIASLTYLQILLNTGIDPMYCSRVSKNVTSQSSFPFKIMAIDKPLINKLILALTSTYSDVRDASFTILEHSLTLDSQLDKNLRLKEQITSYAVQCLNSRRESENGTATLLIRLLLHKIVVKNLEVPSILLPHPRKQYQSRNPLAIFLQNRLDNLETRILEAETNLGQAFEKRPLQGSIMIISELFTSLSKDMINSLVVSHDLASILKQTRKLVSRVWELSAAVLCPSSDRLTDLLPDHEEARAYEFVAVEDEVESLDDEQVSPGKNFSSGTRHKAILSACWRSMKEISALLMHTVKLSFMAGQQNTRDGSDEFLSYQDLVEVGQLFEKWLLEIRHRGAFGAIHSAYSSLCYLLCNLSQESQSSQLPLLWLQAHISAITNRQISTTRRSAGLPYCILSTCQALSISDPTKLRFSLDLILNLAAQEGISCEALVHILNTLKILLTDGKVSPLITSLFIERTYELAIRSFISADWKVRNGALILFSGLTNRVFGTRSLTLDRSHANLCKREPLSEFFRRLPTMPSILLTELRRSIQAGIHDAPSTPSQGPIFAVLSLLALLQNPDRAQSVQDFILLTQECLKSRVSKIRSMGADAMTGLVPSNGVSHWICECLNETTKSRNYNQVHGLLLLTSRLIQIPSSLSPVEKSQTQKALDSSASVLLNCAAIPLLCRSSFLEILESLDTRFGIKLGTSFDLSPELLMEEIAKLHHIRAPALHSYETYVARSLLRKHPDRETVLRLLREGFTATRLTVFEFLENVESQSLLKESEIGETVLSLARRTTDSVSVRIPALKLLASEAASSNLNHEKWNLVDLLEDYDSNQTVTTRDTLLILAGRVLVNSIDSPDDHEFSVGTWVAKILTMVEESAQEEKSTETRLSAAKCLTAFLRFDKIGRFLSIESKLKILELLINLIQDDDDEIRFHLVRSFHQTSFFQTIDQEFNLNEPGVQFELVPNAILKKLIFMSLELDPLFGFRKLMKIEDIQADLDQLFKPSDNLFVTERLNLHRDDLLEFKLIQEYSNSQFCHNPKNQDLLSNPNQKSYEKILEVMQDHSNLSQELTTFYKLLKTVIPSNFDRCEDHNAFESLFINFIDGINGNDVDREPFKILSYRAWISLMFRLYHTFIMFKSFPERYQRSYLLSMVGQSGRHNSHIKATQDPLESLVQDLDDRFNFINKVLIANR